jgi:uncharacterized protein YdhG (YjbR/CyaY superfamily)
MDKPKEEFTNIDEYIALYPKEVQERMQKIRQMVKEIAPEAVETISYRIPTFKLNGKAFAYFAGFAKHIGMYPFPSGVIEFQEAAKDYETSKGTVKFPHDKPIPYELVKKMVLFRLNENIANAKKK